ncbi:MAG: hypothetical protein GX458_16635 [Phyllobacteriaceae bacterium]|nr:hypothetical protein [Phyllobacteriaceae bacterium]
MRSTGGDAILVSGSTEEASAEETGRTAFAEARFFGNYESNDLVETAAVELGAAHRITSVLAFSEADVLRAARIRKRLRLPGQDFADASFFRDKVAMKRRAWERGISVPRFAEITCPADLTEFVLANDLPVVVKPSDGRGSSGVSVLATDEDVKAFLASGASHAARFTVEEYVPGDMYRVDGLYVDGCPVVIHAARYFKDCLAFIRGETIGTHSLDADNPLVGRIETFTRHLLEKALPFPSTSMFHLQIFHTPDDRLVLCEVASRLGGGVINEEVRTATGIDMKLGYVEASTGRYHGTRDHRAVATRPTGRIIIPPKNGVLEDFPLSCDREFVDLYKTYGVVGRRYGGAAMTNAEVASFVFGGDDENQLKSRATDLDDWFGANSSWSA